MNITDIEITNASARSLQFIEWTINDKLYLLYPYQDDMLNANFSRSDGIYGIGLEITFKKSINWFIL